MLSSKSQIGIVLEELKMSKIFRNTILLVSLGLFIIGILFSNAYTLLITILLMLVHNFWYAIEDFYKRVVFLIFNGTFFVFLVGRMVVNEFFKYKQSSSGIYGLNFNEIEIINHTLITLYISLFFLYFGFLFMQKFSRKEQLQKNVSESKKKFWESFKTFSKYFFYFVILFRIIYLYEAMSVVRMDGYYETFSTFQSQMPGLLVLLSNMYDVAFFAFLATKPSKKEAVLPIGLYLIEGVFSLLSGRRSGFMLNILILFIYFCLRNIKRKENVDNKNRSWLKKNRWIGKKEIIGSIFIIPIIMVTLNTIGYFRTGVETINISFVESIFEFLFSQGVSANVIGYTLIYSESLPNKLYSFGPIIEFIDNKIIGHYIYGEAEFLGQTSERALNGYLFAHTISYLVMPNLYLNGVGYGSSFIAELYNDFGYIGIVVGSFIYGVLIGKFTIWFQSKNIIIVLITLMMLRSFLFTPRAATVSFLVSSFSPPKIIAMIIILLGAYIIRAIYYQRKRIYKLLPQS